MKKTIDNIKNSTYDGYNLEEIKKKYNTVISNRSNIDKYTNWRAYKHGTQYGGGFFSDMIDALNIVKIISEKQSEKYLKWQILYVTSFNLF